MGGGANELKVAWLAGLFDGEGCVTASLRGKLRYTPSIRIMITNSDLAVIITACHVLDAMETHYTLKTRRAGKGGRRSDLYDVSLSTESGMLKFVEQMCPYVVSVKRHQLESVKEYYTSREKVEFSLGGHHSDATIVELRSAQGKLISKLREAKQTYTDPAYKGA